MSQTTSVGRSRRAKLRLLVLLAAIGLGGFAATSPAEHAQAQAHSYRTGNPPIISSAQIDEQRRLVVTYTAPDGVTYGGDLFFDNDPRNPQLGTVDPRYGTAMYCSNIRQCLGRWNLVTTPDTGPFTYTTEPLSASTFPAGTYYVQVETTNEDPYPSTRMWEDSNVVTVTVPRKEPPSPGSQVVPIGDVSNGCGGKGWASLVKAQNYIGNRSTFYDANDPEEGLRATKYTVSFKAACDLHDAGYSGVVVRDKLRANQILDFRKWSRKQVDNKFLEDLQWLCRLQIPASAKIARANCMGTGGKASIGAKSRYNFVRLFGCNFFDADPTVEKRQRKGPRVNNRCFGK